MVNGFWHGLDDAFVVALNHAYRSGGWWRSIVDVAHADGDLFIAIRDGYLNVYWRGASLIKLGYRGGQLNGEIHYKYLLRPSLPSPYVNIAQDGSVDVPDPRMLLLKDVSDVEALKAAAQPYTGGEKTGVHDIIKCNTGVVDTEIAFGRGDTADSATAPRVDFAVLQDQGDVARLVFFEAKQFSNQELKAGGVREPKVVAQINGYSALLAQHRSALEASYRRVFENFLALEGLAGSHPSRDRLMRQVLTGEKGFEIDTQPRLVIFGFDNDQKQGGVWLRHKKKLQELLGEARVLLKGNTSDFTRGISAL